MDGAVRVAAGVVAGCGVIVVVVVVVVGDCVKVGGAGVSW